MTNAHKGQTFSVRRSRGLVGRPVPAQVRAAKVDKIGCFLVAAAVCLSPVLDTLPGIAGFGFAWMLYGLLAVWVATSYSQSLFKAACQPLFLAAALFVLVSFVAEASQSNRDFSSLSRFVQAAVGALLVTCLCRTRETLAFALRSLAWFACAVSLVLIFTSYGKLSGVDVDEFEGASILRSEVFASSNFFRDLNRWSFLCGLGAPIGLALLSRSTSLLQRLRWAGVSFICILGAAMPLSRSGIMVTLGACGAVLLWSGGKRLKLIVAAAVIVVCAYAIAPSALIQRFKGSGVLQEESQDARQVILYASLKHIPDYWLFGVGFAGYWDSWAAKVGITNKRGFVRGPHNSYFAVWIYWGAPALLSFALMLYFAFRCLPKGVGRDPLALCLLGLAVAMLLRLLFTHVFYVKDCSAILGLLAAARLWVWRSEVTARGLRRAEARASSTASGPPHQPPARRQVTKAGFGSLS